MTSSYETDNTNPRIQTITTTNEHTDEPFFQGPIKYITDRLINIKTMSPFLKRLTFVALILVMAIAILLGTSSVQPILQFNVLGSSYQLPQMTVIGIIILLFIGYGYIIIGALQVRWWVRLPIMAAITFSLTYGGLISNLRSSPTPFRHNVAIGQLIILIILDLWALVIPLFRKRSIQKTAHFGITVSIVMALIIGYFVLEYVGVILNIGSVSTNEGFLEFSDDLFGQIFILTFLLNLLVLWSSTDFIEWGETIAHGIASAVERTKSTWLVALLPILASLGIIIDVALSHLSMNHLPTYILTVLMLLLMIGGILLAHIDTSWKTEDLALGLFAGAAYLYSVYELPAIINILLGLHGSAEQHSSIFLTVLIDFVALGSSLILILMRKENSARLKTIGLFLLFVLLLNLTKLAQDLVDATGLAITPLPGFSVAVLRGLIAIGSLGYTIMLLIRRLPKKLLIPQFVNIFFLLIGIQSILWIDKFTANSTNIFQKTSVIMAAFFLGATIWDVLLSGQQITNRDTTAFPRNGRVLLYFGNTLIGAALLVFIGTIKPSAFSFPGGVFSFADLENSLFPIGLYFLGIPFVFSNFAFRMGSMLVPATARNTRQQKGVSILQWTIAGVVLIATITSSIFSFTRPIADTLKTAPVTTSQPYFAHIPGNCDYNGAIWVSKTTGRCLSMGLSLPLDPVGSFYGILLEFNPPSGVYAQNYKISIHFDLTPLKGSDQDACISMATRDNGTQFYQEIFCRNGKWEIDLIQSATQTTTLASETTSPASNGTMMVIANGTEQTLVVNGTTLATLNNATLSTTSLLSILAISQNGGSILLSDFTYTPLRTPHA